MLIDEIKKANMMALKNHDVDTRNALSIVISRYLELKTNGSGKEVTDVDVAKIIQKFDKELDEEKDGYVKAGRAEQAANVDKQKAVIAGFLPKQLSEEEVRKIYAGLEDKALPSVMKHFKTNYG